MREEPDISWVNPFDPVAFAEKWYEDHPDILDEHLRISGLLDKVRMSKEDYK